MALVSDAELRNMVVKVDHHLDGTNKDSILGAVTHWLCEIGELDSSLKKDVARLKGFLTNNYDKVRRPYAKADSEYPRRTVFIATVNDRNFLVDPTGNTRFWTISVKALNFKHEIDMQQLFAQMAVNMEHGAEWWLTPDEERVLEDYNRQHRNVSLVSDVVLKHMDLDYKGAANLAAMTPMELLKEAGIDHPNNAQCKECAGLLREVLGDSKRIKGRDVWRIPVKPSDSKFAKMMPANTIDEDDDDRY
jgi:putative DNA primase/helicase